MARRSGGAPGGVLRTYARLRPLRRVEPQRWFSPTERQHLFSSSSSSLLDSSCDACDDPDFLPSKRTAPVISTRQNLQPTRGPSSRNKKKQRSSGGHSEDKENHERVPSSSSVVFSTPFRKFVTLRRKAPGPGVAMKPLSSKPRREAGTDSCDFEAEHLTVKKKKRRRRLRMSPDVSSLLSSLADAPLSPPHKPPLSPLHKPPLHSSTPSMMLTAVPRKDNSFIRQLALSEPLEDSLVICCVDSDVNEHSLHPPPQRGDTRGRRKALGAPRTESCGPGSGVKRLMIRSNEERRPSSVCVLSPVTASSVPSVALMGEGTSDLQEPDDDVFGASAELFSGNFTLGKEEPPPPSDNLEGSPSAGCQRRSVLDSLGGSPSAGRQRRSVLESLGGNPSAWCQHRFSPNKWKHFSRKAFQPVVRLDARSVTRYLQQKSRDRQGRGAARCEVQLVPPGSHGGSAPVTDSSLGRVRPVVTLDSAAVSKYLLEKVEASTDPVDLATVSRNEQAADRTFGSPTFQTTAKTPHPTTSVLKLQTSVVPPSVGTGRKVCISGFSAKRWGTLRKKPAAKTPQQLSFQDRSREDLGVGDPHSASFFSSSFLTSSFLNSTAVMNLNLSTESLSGRDPHKDHQRWARLRAALSLHRRKKVEAGSPSNYQRERRNRGKMSLSSQNSSLLLLSPFRSSLCAHEPSDAEKVLAECQQETPISFYQFLSREQLRDAQKVGEGVYGEVFRTLRGAQHVALKVIPIEGAQKVNGEHQKSFAEILPEIIISKELSLLSEGDENQTSGFIQLHSAHCVQGSYPPELLSAWDTFADEKGTENERPDLFGPEQLFMILEFEFGGEDLERMSSRLPSVAASRSILHQVTAALAVAEEELRFEHRDLHWGNLLIEKSSSSSMSVSLGGEVFNIPSAGIQVKIIDYTLSRLDKDGLTVFCDLSTDEDLFLGQGDLQFEVYRMMRQENQNVWSSYRPHSNILWLHYLSDKLLNEVKYRRKPTSGPQRRELRRLQDFRREVQQFGSATEVLKNSPLFK